MNIQDTIVYKKLATYRGLFECKRCRLIPVSKIDLSTADESLSVDDMKLFCKCGAPVDVFPIEETPLPANTVWC